MIQRIQSVWLLLASISSTLCFFLPFAYAASGDQLVGLTSQSHWYLFLITLLVGLASLITIFLYHDRALQKKITLSTAITQGLLLIIFTFQTMDFPKVGPSLFCVIHFGILFFLLMALKGIKKDIQTISESEHLR